MVVAAQLVAQVSVQGASAAKQQLSDMKSKVDDVSGGLRSFATGAAVAGATALIGIGVASTKMAADFQSGITSLVTGAGESKSNIKLVSDGILAMAPAVGTTTKALTDGMYMIESSGQHGAQALDTLKMAAEGAKVGNASLADVANGVTTAMTDYASKHLTAAQATNTLIATVAAGKTHMQDLAQSLSTILPTASAFGVSLGDTTAALATMTGEGVPAADAATYLRQTLSSLENPATKAQGVLKEIGLTSAQVSDEMKVSLPGTLQLITDHLKTKFPEGSAAYNAALANIAGGSKQMQGMLDLTGQHLDTFKSNVSGIADAVKKGGNSITGWSDVQGTFNFKMDQAKETLETLGIKIGTQLLPVLGKMLDAFSSPGFQAFATTVANDITNALLGLINGITTIVNIGAGLVNFFQHNQIAMDLLVPVVIALAGAIGGALAFAFYTAAAAAWVAAAGFIAAAAIPIAIGVAIALAVAGIVLAVQHWGDITKWFQGVWGAFSSWFMGILGDVGNFFKNIWNGISTWFMGVINGIKSFFVTAWNDVGNFFKVVWNDILSFLKIVGIALFIAITGPIGLLAIYVIEHWKQISDTAKQIFGPFVAFMGSVFQTIWNIIVAIIGKIGNWFHDRWNEVVAVFTPIGNWFHDRFNEAWNAIVTVFQGIGNWFGDRWKDIQKIFAVVGNWFHDRFAEAHDGVQTGWSNTSNWFQDRWKDIQTTFAPVGQWFKDRFTEAWNNIVTIFTPIGHWFQDKWNGIVSDVIAFKDNIVSKFMDVKDSVLNTFHDFINGIVDKLNDGISAVENFINFFGQGLDSIAKALGTTGTIPVAHLARIPHYAGGTDAHPGGPAIVGEQGREMVWLPAGAKVAPNDITEALLASSGGKIPGYANGIGDLTASIQNWISSGAKSILDNVMSALHISSPTIMGLADVGTGLLNKVKEWAVGWITKLLPSGGSGGSAGPGQAVNVPGDVASWIQAAIALTGVPNTWLSDLETIAMHESGGNPNIQNNWDSNAAAGDPSRGLMQTIGSTFAAHMVAGHGNILNPIDNAAAAINYIKGRYGDVFHVPGIISMMNGGAYQGYANGTDNAPGGMAWVGENGPEFMYVPKGAQITPNSQLGKQQVVNVTVQGAPVYLDGRMLSNGLMPHITNAIRTNVGTHRL